MQDSNATTKYLNPIRIPGLLATVKSTEDFEFQRNANIEIDLKKKHFDGKVAKKPKTTKRKKNIQATEQIDL